MYDHDHGEIFLTTWIATFFAVLGFLSLVGLLWAQAHRDAASPHRTFFAGLFALLNACLVGVLIEVRYKEGDYHQK